MVSWFLGCHQIMAKKTWRFTLSDGTCSLPINFTERRRHETISTWVIIIISTRIFLCNFNSFTVPTETLEDGAVYSFQVASVSSNSFETYSTPFEILTPQYRIVKAIMIGAVLLLILLALAGILFYMKRNIFSTYHNDDKL